MAPNDKSEKGWAVRLAAQGIAQDRVEDARNAGLAMTDALEGLRFDTSAPIAPGVFADILRPAGKPGR